MTVPDSQHSDSRLTNLIAQGTGEILKGIRGVGLLRGRELGEAGDDLAQNWIARVLAQHRPDDGFLSEEAADNSERLDKERVWIVDPLDGTKEFATGRQDWAVHVALVENGVPTHAAVGLPDLGVVFKSSDVRHVSGPLSRRIALSRNRPPKVAQFVADKLDFETVGVGSAGAKAMHVLLGDYDAYIHAGGQYEWDQAAPVGVSLAAGLHASRLDGSELRYNNADTYIPDLLICRPELAEDILKACAEYLEQHGSFDGLAGK
ncbi:3'(2'),5'-bisphosphate nucleotidase CysQ [Corynebacterium sanguinis]|uniref:3'(2'),5'-bisphosphate nucleotidase CysQ n=1 Tax=Corynebacterium sanguinis TaxID=2594913 RepID=UPI0011A02DA6|nr:3'(2'),5'-bisphosphate nucleotidase CysQ [Corynebacterium sanguinis]MCT1613688.1 3'(2'),5'-bisphosphate nucleotidase CysQ [Corynebacterium sanguinis]TVS22579.1 3'(2'),5'-bisphosphate nucleotidase CysQ [Corynebacterium sanguinis]